MTAWHGFKTMSSVNHMANALEKALELLGVDDNDFLKSQSA